MACGALADISRLQSSGWQPDLIDAHYLYPDAVAAATLSAKLNVPFVMTARGTDVNVLAAMAGPGRRIAQAAACAKAVITVSQSLKDRLVSLGLEEAKIVVLRNGVDLDVFELEDRQKARARLGLPSDGRWLISVGNLVPEKGQGLAMEVLTHLPGYRLLIVGDGPLRGQLMAMARRLGLDARVDFRPAMPQHELRQAYAAADALLVTSTAGGLAQRGAGVTRMRHAGGRPWTSVRLGR